MKSIGFLTLCLMLLVGCDQLHSSTSGNRPDLDTDAEPSLSSRASVTPPLFTGALFERTWVNDHQWELVKPRPPGIGANGQVPIHIYQIAPVFEDDPLSPEIEVPGFITLGGRDHVIDMQRNLRRDFRGVANTVPVQFPGWNPLPPFGSAGCSVPDLGALSDRIAWRWVEVSVHPCGQIPMVYAVDFEDSGCMQPLTTVEHIHKAVDEGFAELNFPPEEPWPFAIRRLTGEGQGTLAVKAPSCM